MTGSRLSMQTYYDVRAPEYDRAYRGEDVWDGMQPGLYDEVPAVETLVASLPPLQTLDVACCTGYLTRHLRGDVIGLDFMAEAGRVAKTVVILDDPAQDEPDLYLFVEGQNEGWEERPLLDGTVHKIYKKYFRPEGLVEEMGGAEVLYSTKWFLAAAI